MHNNKSQENILITNNYEINLNNNKINLKINKEKINEKKIKNKERKEIYKIFNIEKIISSPNRYCFAFEKINIFNSILIMINNIQGVSRYSSDDNIKKIINHCILNNEYSLSSLLCHLNNSFWKDTSYLKIEKLLEEYKEYINYYTNLTSRNTNINRGNYCYDNKNIESILKYIFNKINEELTPANEIYCKKKKTSFNNDDLSRYLFEFSKNNFSIISKYFMGFYEISKVCEKCKKIQNLNIKYGYDCFSFLSFNLNEVYKYIQSQNNISLMNNGFNNEINFQLNNNNSNIKNININDCFNYLKNSLLKKNHKNSYCNFCCSNYSKEELYFSEIIAIVLSNAEDYNFILQDEFDLKPFVKRSIGDGIYYPISVLCQISYNKKYICYCINPNNGYWYSYEDDGKIVFTKKMDIKAIPLIIVYKIRGKIPFEYKKIQRYDLNRIGVNVKFINGFPEKKLFFDKFITIKKVIKEISFLFHLEESKLAILCGGEKTESEQLLLYVLNNNNSILVIFKN